MVLAGAVPAVRVAVVSHTSLGAVRVDPDTVPATGQVTPEPALVTSPAGIVAQASAAARRYCQVTEA